jgi:hypothetical protein
LSLLLIVFVTMALAWHASAEVFTEDAEIGPLDTNYDGQDIVILDCTVTVDGPHTFSSLVLADNGVLTHSFSTNGQLPVAIINVTNASYVLSGTTPDELANSNIFSPLLVTDPTQTIRYTNGVDYLEINQTNGNTVLTFIELMTNSSIPDGGTVLVSYSYDGNVAVGLDLTVTGVVWVTSGCEIDADGIGYGPGFGPGPGSSSGSTFFDGSGGGDGGSGGMSLSNAVGGVCYDSLYQPAFPGSGGGASYAGSGGNGGGLVQITAGGEVEIDGVITANGDNATNPRAGGGSGGGIWISAPSVSGAGSITANGGSGAPGYGGGGGGGRIAINCGTNNFTGTMSAYGGGGANYGGAGTIFNQLTGQNGLLTLNNGGNTGASSTVTLSNAPDVVITGNAVAAVPLLSGTLSFGTLTIGTNSVLMSQGLGSLELYAYSNLTIQAGGALLANGLGSLNSGNGQGGIFSSGGIVYGGGGGHGGYGGASTITNASGGLAYDSASLPNNAGSLGGGDNVSSFGGSGGGLIHVYVSGVLQDNGRISANGANGFGNAGGGGSGGTISLDVGTLSGNGTITANGGNGANVLGGGGGGGCIAIAFATNNFSGPMTAYGGGGASYGGAGTIYSGVNGSVASLVLDNGGNSGPSTPLQSGAGANLVVQDGAWGLLSPNSGFSSLVVGSNAWVTATASSTANVLTILNNATLQAGGGLTLNAGALTFGGNGFGGYTATLPYPGGGGGNGGSGGVGATNYATGGVAGFNSITSPSEAGGGGGGDSPYSTGGTGGGALKLTVDGTMLVNGVISANGGNGSGAGGGGGAGGSLALSAGTLAGSGSIIANGGNGVGLVGGGGGGGCIAVVFNTNNFSGMFSALGGEGANDGGAGIIYFKTNSSAFGQIIVDNGGQNGSSSAIQSVPADTDLIVRNNSILNYGSGASLNFGNVLITNASLVISNYPLTITATTITLQHGGEILANSAGYPQNTGPGAGRATQFYPYYAGSGGGNGGCGGMAFSNTAAGGNGAIGLYTQPVVPGSGGGGESPYSIGGTGGGVLELNVSGTLAVNGILAVNGGNGSGSGGGGAAGGSLQLNIGSLTGSGVISANGGNGISNLGGGGGGGMIAINYKQGIFSSNSFSGTISAYGGTGATNGGAGTIFISTNGLATLILDNGGNRGTNTPITISSSSYALSVRNGAVAALQPGNASFSSLLITSNAWVVPNATQPGQIGEVNLSLSGNATIQAGGGIIADSSGYAQNVGGGHGSSYAISPSYPCSGAGHGGDGAFGISNLVPGGTTYDSITQPSQYGSGGGGYAPYSTGGTGGGIVDLNLNATGTLQVNGIISANGGNGSGTGGGGGSGGTINLTASTITGTGSITANGGNGAPNGGGGGGGCISLYSTAEYKTNYFLGNVSAYGGGGANYGGAGTLYCRTNNSLGLTPVVYLDNDNNVGTNTVLTVNQVNVVIQKGAIGAISTSPWIPNAVLVLSNSELTSLVGQTTVRATSLTISTGAVFSVDGVGYEASSGLGAGSVNGGVSGGGGHGGYGGAQVGASGEAFDSIQTPVLPGGGGANSSTGIGGAGGGALTLEVAQSLIVNGRISANGRPGSSGAGGGAGGSIYIAQGLNGVSGNGIISASGGAGSGSGGGGAGGRISLVVTGLFTGQSLAIGGTGGSPGGAGTVFTSAAGSRTLLINNGGLVGAETPLSSTFLLPSTPFELDISGGASVVPLTPLPLLSNLNVSVTSTLTMPFAQSNFLISVISNAMIAGDLDVDYLGYPQTNGPGAGVAIDDEGSGGGYGGAGGASDSGAPGGTTYGSRVEPVDFGSGGGNGADTATGGSSGGGALHLSVVGTLTVNGNISANGDSGLQDDSGGGSGGSVWLTAGTLSGTGTIASSGGDGLFYGGSGGGGGRIAIYAANNQFTGTTNVIGGAGAKPGQPGTVFLSSAYNGLQILSQSPTGLVLNAVSSVNLDFSDMLNPASVTAANFTLLNPAGVLAASNLSATVTGPYSVQLNFPTQNLNGTYTVEAATSISDMFGASLAQPYSGTFIISLPVISGTVTGTNGLGVPGVSLQSSDGLIAGTTDSNGNYSVTTPTGWTGIVTPSFGSSVFVPPSVSYTNVTSSATNQNYLVVATIAPGLTTSLSAGNFSLNWNGIAGATYQVLYSTNLVNWQPLGSPLTGTNGPMQVVLPTGSNAAEFFQLQAGD